MAGATCAGGGGHDVRWGGTIKALCLLFDERRLGGRKLLELEAV